MPATKLCIRCQETKPLTDFSRSSASSDGCQTYCKPCVLDYMRARRGPPVPLPEKDCATCGTPFVPTQRKSLYCSTRCKTVALYWRRHPSKAGKRCQACGKDISHMRGDAKWCSLACANKRPTAKAVKRRTVLKTQYGMTPERYDAMLEAQGGVCAICGSAEIRGYGKRLAIDHCHDSKRVRGILCGKCNRGIGCFDHDPERLAAAVAYLNA